jgi:hypothetical protein
VRDQLVAHDVTESILQFHGLNEKVMLRVQARGSHGRLEIQTKPFLDALVLQLRRALGEIEEETKSQD